MVSNSAAVLVVLFLVVSLCVAQQAPIWPSQFQQTFSETTYVPIIGHHNTTGAYYYDATRNMTRLDRASGKFDRYCGTVKVAQDTPCTHLVRDSKRYLVFPKLNYCCVCCTADKGCGILNQNWLASANFTGYQTENSIKFETWTIKGLQSNVYWSTADAKRIPYRIDQQPNDVQTFDLKSYQESISNPDQVFALPNYCSPETKCGGICYALSKGFKHSKLQMNNKFH